MDADDRLAEERGDGELGDVREALLGGGSLGDAYGRIWEDFYEHSFRESDWQVLGRDLVLRRQGKPVTDVDLLVKRSIDLMMLDGQRYLV